MSRKEDWDFEALKLLYQSLKDRESVAAHLQGDYGKWIVSSLLLLHGGSLAFIATDDGMKSEAIKSLIFWHIPGIVMALACAFAAWINWGLHWNLYQSVDARMIVSNDHWPKFDGKASKWINPTMWASIILGCLSVVCLCFSAFTIYYGIKA